MAVTPVVVLALVVAAAQFQTASAIYVGFACVAMLVVAAGIASSIFVTLGRATLTERALGLFFSVINLLALNGIIMLFQPYD
jgi:hypothetical protein